MIHGGMQHRLPVCGYVPWYKYQNYIKIDHLVTQSCLEHGSRLEGNFVLDIRLKYPSFPLFVPRDVWIGISLTFNAQLHLRSREIWLTWNLVSVAVTPVRVAKLKCVSIGDVESAIFQKNHEMAITKHSLYSPGARIFTKR